VKHEELIGFNVDHLHICNMTSDYPGISAVASFIESVLEAAQTHICRKSEGGAFNIVPKG